MLLSRCSDSNFAGNAPSPKKKAGAKSDELGSTSNEPSSNVISEDPCAKSPFKGQTPTIKNIGSSVRTSLFHKAVGTDPGKTNNDPSVTSSYRMPPITIAPDSELAQTTFEFSSQQLADLAANQAGELEVIAFAHQFGRGTDRISLEVATSAETLSDVSPTNIFSAYGYVSIKNIKVVDKVARGDVDVFSFNYNPNGSGALHDKLKANPSVRDSTDLIGPASEATTARVSKKDVDLSGLKITVKIDALVYDSVQYRAIRVNT